MTFAVRLAGKDVDGDAISYAVAGAPNGITLMSNGILTGATARGTYRLTVTLRDAHGATGSGVITLIVA